MALIGLAVGLGLAAARLPLGPAMAVTLGPALLALIFIEPAVGLGLTLIAAPLKAYLARVYPGLPLDPGQLFFAVTLAAWLARGAARREIKIPHLPSSACPRAVSGVFLSLTLFISISALSLWAAPSLPDGFGELIKWAQIGLMAALVFDCGRRNRALAFILGAVFAAGAIQAGLGLWQFSFSANEPAHFRILGDHFRAFGTFEQPNPFGGFMGLLWPVAAGLTAWTVERRVWSDSRFTLHASHSTLLALLTSLFLLSLALSFSRGAWLGAAAAGVTLLAFLPRRLWLGLGLVTVALIGGLWLAERGLLPQAITARIADLGDFTQVYDARGAHINEDNYAVLQRLAFWQAAEGMADAHPWLGVGIGNYPVAYPGFALLNWPQAIGHAHNIYLNMLAEVGLLGLAAYLIFWASVVALTLRALRANTDWRRGLALGVLAAWAHLAVHGLVDNLYVNNIHLFVGAYVGLLALTLKRPLSELENHHKDTKARRTTDKALRVFVP